MILTTHTEQQRTIARVLQQQSKVNDMKLILKLYYEILKVDYFRRKGVHDDNETTENKYLESSSATSDMPSPTVAMSSDYWHKESILIYGL